MHYLIIDGNNLLHRVYWIAKHKNQETTNLYIELFIKSLRTYYNLFTPERMICTWDKKMFGEEPNFRQKLCEYKQNRDAEYNTQVYQHIDELNRFMLSLGIKIMYPGYLEADDIIHWCTTQHTNDTFTVVSADKDLLQLVSQNTVVYNPVKKQIYNNENFVELLGVTASQFVLQKAIIGDVSDNIKGLTNIGIKRAQKYINGELQFTPEQQVIIDKNKQLVDLSQGWQINEPREQKIYEKQFSLKWPNPLKKVFFTLCLNFSLYKIMKNPEQYNMFFKE